MPDKTLGAYQRHESPDLMDGGVTAALIEAEARGHDYTPCTHETDSEHWQARWQEAADQRDARRAMAALWKETTRRALRNLRTEQIHHQLTQAALDSSIRSREEAEKERDEALRQRHEAHLSRDYWLEEHSKAEQAVEHLREEMAACDVHSGVIEVTEEMAERAREEFFGGDVGGPVSGPSSTRRWRAALTAALTEPPARPEGAEEIEAVLRSMGDIRISGRENVANFLAERGVRVVTEGEQT